MNDKAKLESKKFDKRKLKNISLARYTENVIIGAVSLSPFFYSHLF